MVVWFSKETDDIKKFMETAGRRGADVKIMVLDDVGNLLNGAGSLCEYVISAKNQEEYDERALFGDLLEVPEFREIRLEGAESCLYEAGRKRAVICFADPVEKKNVERVEWNTESGWIFKIDYYNRYGTKYASEFLDADKNVESKVYYSDRNQEMLVIQPQNQVITLLENGVVKAVFHSYAQFVEFCITEIGDGDKNILFVQEENCRFQKLEADGESVWDAVLFSDPELLEKYRNAGGKNGYRFYSIPEEYPVNHVSKNALILTASDQIEKLDELSLEMPDMVFHIAAHTQVSDKLYKLAERENVMVYPGVSKEALDGLWEKCDFYLDINHYREIDNAVDEASRRNLVLMGFEDTVHQRELMAGGCVYAVEDYKNIAEVIRYLKKNHVFTQKLLLAQQKKRERVSAGIMNGTAVDKKQKM